jgi:hypothetical protein
MKNKLSKYSNFIALFVIVFAFGCSTKGSYIPSNNAPEIPTNSVFFVGEVTDSSGFKFPANEPQSLDLKQTMIEALTQALKDKGALGDESNYVINVEVLDYKPGNAFARWLLPGAGATKLKVVASILDQNKVTVATIPVERSIGFGGAYTIGAWRYVFHEVATEIVGYLTNKDKRK